jgi:tripartite-type tricarboxylate transporter receptor subunit TctC
MTMPRHKVLLGTLLAALMLAGPTPALAQAKYPNRAIRMLIPFAPGGGVDVVARVVGQKLGELIGQPILVESKPGAGGAIATAELMRSEPDGYTLLMTTSSHATLPVLNKLPWHPSNDFTPIAAIYSTMFVMATNKASTSHFRTLPEFLAYVRANLGKISWARRASPARSILAACSSPRLPASTWCTCPTAATARCFRLCLPTKCSSPSTPRRCRFRISRAAS